MIKQPKYFERIRREAQENWKKLEDSGFKGGILVLFEEIRSSRHVVSELLQNAEDAGATEASMSIADKELIFAHNGRDFTEEDFASLCRFGYSNKRVLHTIGFYGVGFKSTFSLGDEVRLFTPTLAVAFKSKSFTEPDWIERNEDPPSLTEVHMHIENELLQEELENSLKEWRQSPASLLFFRSIQSLKIKQQEVRLVPAEPGPVRNSERRAFSADPGNKYLLLRSEAEEFPTDAINEIRRVRKLPVKEGSLFPPCRVEIVPGMEGRLFAILPTGVKTNLPFACNAPFVQKPDRTGIEYPASSPTNRWLLERAGKLAANAMLEWLRNEDMDIEERCKAYDLLPNVDRDDDSLAGTCATIVEKAFEETIENERFLLTEDGNLVAREECISVPSEPSEILDVWTPEQVTKIFDSKKKRPVLHRGISTSNRKKLVGLGYVEEVEKSGILNILESKHLPKPDTDQRLLTLWDFVSNNVSRYYYKDYYKEIRIVPVQGKTELYSANEVVRLDEEGRLRLGEDWDFMSEHILLIDPEWLKFLDEHRNDGTLGNKVKKAFEVLETLGLDENGDVSSIIKRVAEVFSSKDDCPVKDFVRLAQIAAKAGISLPNGLQFVTSNGDRKVVDDDDDVGQEIIADLSGDLKMFFSDEWYGEHVLHDEYGRFISCTKDEWQRWIKSGKSRLLTFIPLNKVLMRIRGLDKIRMELSKRGFVGEADFPYRREYFDVEDWDFHENHWEDWYLLATRNPDCWGLLFARILIQPKAYSLKSAQIWQRGNFYKELVTDEYLLPGWVKKFRFLPCLRDTKGHYRKPSELMLRNSKTEKLLDVETFIRHEDDNDKTRPLLIKLGVRTALPRPDGLLLNPLRKLAKTKNTHLPSGEVYKVYKLYDLIDKLFYEYSPEYQEEIRNAFVKEELILTEKSEWARASEVFLKSADIPDSALVHKFVRKLSLWGKIGVADHPPTEVTLEWLKNLRFGHKISGDKLKQVRFLLRDNAEKIWNDYKHWLNLEGEWVPVDSLEFRITRQSKTEWEFLFSGIKQKTADLRDLVPKVCQQAPFSELRDLSTSIEDRFSDDFVPLTSRVQKDWIRALGRGLSRIIFKDETKTKRVRKIAGRLANTRWQVVKGLKTVPYIDGAQAGKPRPVDVFWKDELLYVEDNSVPSMLVKSAQELARTFDEPDIEKTILFCVERPTDFINEYLETIFKLVPAEEPSPLKNDKTEMRNGETRQGTVKETGTHRGHRESQHSSHTTGGGSGDTNSEEREIVERLAMDAVMVAERKLGFEPIDVSAQRLGYDIKSWYNDGKMHAEGPRLIEVKGRARGSTTVSITINEIWAALDNPEQYILAIVEVEGDKAAEPVYIRRPCTNQPDPEVTSINYDIKKMRKKGEPPR